MLLIVLSQILEKLIIMEKITFSKSKLKKKKDWLELYSLVLRASRNNSKALGLWAGNIFFSLWLKIIVSIKLKKIIYLIYTSDFLWRWEKMGTKWEWLFSVSYSIFSYLTIKIVIRKSMFNCTWFLWFKNSKFLGATWWSSG